MIDKELLLELLASESEEDAVNTLEKRGLFSSENAPRWIALGKMPNNQSIVHGQMSTPTAALVEKITNGLDAILLRHCKAEGIDPRSMVAPQSMGEGIKQYFGDLNERSQQELRAIAERNLILYATGSKSRPCLSLYDSGEGQLPERFSTTFCSLIYGDDEGSYKGAVPFVQGRFNMGGSGALPFCGDRKMQLIVSRVPSDLESAPHEWGFTVICFFPSPQNPTYRYLVGEDGHVLTAGDQPIALVPKLEAKSGEICEPRERSVPSGTLVKMYNYQAPISNICGELYKKLGEFLLRPALPLRIIECRVIAQSGVLASESSGDQIDVRHLNTVFELYSSYHLGQVVEAA